MIEPELLAGATEAAPRAVRRSTEYLIKVQFPYAPISLISFFPTWLEESVNYKLDELEKELGLVRTP